MKTGTETTAIGNANEAVVAIENAAAEPKKRGRLSKLPATPEVAAAILGAALGKKFRGAIKKEAPVVTINSKEVLTAAAEGKKAKAKKVKAPKVEPEAPAADAAPAAPKPEKEKASQPKPEANDGLIQVRWQAGCERSLRAWREKVKDTDAIVSKILSNFPGKMRITPDDLRQLRDSANQYANIEPSEITGGVVTKKLLSSFTTELTALIA